ncbi:uncharacterized protein Schip1 isoform X2 [Fopius arisanus]|uniref:Uncharacterized protein Schip1 isoform X2 n=1 Tax=Fopius arisanus TaxID=64838 RepID=A0A9R1TWW6_9HYME|nr:PREDICTED: uncharacterized protein LOC105264107 isoform X2 [Fopius arisanus]
MRIKDVLAPVGIHPGLNNNEIDRASNEIPSTSDQIENFNNTSTKPGRYDENFDIQEFRIAEDTTTWSSVAVARTNVNVNSKHLNSIINNNNLSVSRLSLSSSAESLSDYEAHELSGGSDCSDNSEEGSVPGSCRGIINPNYPGFQHLAPSFLSIFGGEEQPPETRRSSPRCDDLNFSNQVQNNNQDHSGDSVNRLDGRKSEHKFFYEKPKLNIQTVTSYYEGVVSPSEKCLNYVKSIEETHTETSTCENNESIPSEEHHTHWNNIPVEIEFAELQSSSTERPQFAQIEEIPPESAGKNPEQDSETEEPSIELPEVIPEVTEIPVETKTEDSETNTDSEGLSEEQLPYKKLEEIDLLSSIGRDIGVDLEKYVQPVPDVVAMEAEVHSRPLPGLVKDTLREDTNKLVDLTQDSDLSVDSRKKEKMVRNQARRRQQGHGPQRHGGRTDKRRLEHVERAGGFDVYNIETAMPKIDLDAIESHLRAAREEERRRRNDREEIRRRLAMGPDADDIRLERGRKPSLQSRLQSGMNLQICFMNETPSDTESPNSDSDSPLNVKHSQGSNGYGASGAARPQVLSLPPLRLETDMSSAPLDEADFFARQARLQTEARMALAQAKEMAHMQMEVERQRLKQSPITEMVRCSLEKVGVQLGETRRRLSRTLLTELNVAQLQVIANDLHARIAVLNEALVEGLLRRDDLHMEQDSMLVDVEDLTRYLNK